MRIISYNILDGGEGRADPLAEVILAQKPDVVAIVEAADLSVLERLSARLEMDFIHADGQNSAAALFSRFAIRDSVNHAALHSDFSKAFLEATVIDPSGVEIPFGVVHLPAHAKEEDEALREQSLKLVLKTFEPLRSDKRRHVLCGDFNANSPVQRIDISKCKPSTQEEYRHNGNVIPRRVVQTILDHGYVDTLHHTDPRAAETGGTFTTQFPGQRVDYIFAFGFDPADLGAGWIETDRLATYASDHYPVGAEIRVRA